jgi:hypothetical protein
MVGQSTGVCQLHGMVGIYWQYLGHPDGVILACVAWYLLA